MDNLEKLKYTELRNLAKSLGLKAKGKADKLIRDIRNHNEENGTSTQQKRSVSVCSTSSSSSEDPEIAFSLNPVPGAADVEEVTRQSEDDDEIVFVLNPSEEEDANNDEGNKSAELESIEDKLCENDQQNDTVEFEEHQATESELVDEVEEQLNTTFEIETDKDDQGDNVVEEEEEMPTKEEKADDVDNVKELLEVMRPEMTDEEMKVELMAAIDKKVKNKKVTIMSPNAASEFVSRIPTFSTTVQKSQANEEKPTLKGKDWQKIHDKLFSKQDPLDVYLAKKNKRMQRMTTPAKRIAAESQKTVEKLKQRKDTKSATKSSVKKPTHQSFIPKILSTKSMSLQFSTTSTTVSSVTKSTHIPVASTNQKNKMIKSAKKSPRKSLSDSAKKTIKRTPAKMSPAKSPLVKKPFTPYNFGNTSLVETPDTAKKAKFDLQASLAKPMTWKPHTGKLRPIAFGEVEPQYFKKGLNTSIQTNRENRRAVTAKSRANKRNNILNSRRNIK